MSTYTISKPEVNLSDETIKSLEIVKKLKKNLDQRPVIDIESNDTLKEINKTLKVIKEQNDEIIGDVF